MPGGVQCRGGDLADQVLTGRGAGHEHAAAIRGVGSALGEVEVGELVERAGDDRLGDLEVGGEAADGVSAFDGVAGQEDAELVRRQGRTVAADEADDGVTKHEGSKFRRNGNRHCARLPGATACRGGALNTGELNGKGAWLVKKRNVTSV